ncbi:type II toxin-antitoxin system RelE/ParE family toxin [Polynucleobacter sp. Ross1-W9]|uniref:type II toxin-antitoxin system RelE/ParE family toxin n=1 Tax=Polynucleobacter parvulilacunae TaxID=1855631 RepID=UPI001C0B645F|nr:type II toxin-antitoxin system RelE/ParE family toxin [Polynucleobacter parvulilacunae]MBU3556808.1 type II toxin-antitoxin system RelE/ParE family toxin [Polynucleobacter parvulilacunae]
MTKKRILKTKTFSRWLNKNDLNNHQLLEAVEEMEKGLVDADLGCNVYKKRVKLPGMGKRSGARIIVATKLLKRWYLIFGFSKNERSNISNDELLSLQETAKRLLHLSDQEIEAAIYANQLKELKIDEK